MKNMKNKVLGLVLVLFIIMSLGFVYKKFQPIKQEKKTNAVASTYNISNDLNYNNFEAALSAQDGTYYLWFCDTNDTNCDFIEKEYISEMLNILQIESFDNIIKVDFTDCPLSNQKLQNKFNVSNRLSFVKVVVEGGQITYSNALSWSEQNPITYDTLKQWLYDNQIWQDTYNKKAND